MGVLPKARRSTPCCASAPSAPPPPPPPTYSSLLFLPTPQAYTLSSAEAYAQYGALNVQAGCTFCEEEFQGEARALHMIGYDEI